MTRVRRLTLIVLCLMFIPWAHAQDAWPPENPDGWVLAHVDVETTGLDPVFHEMIDIGMIYTDLDGEELGRLFLRIMPAHPERIDEGARNVNAFDVDDWRAHGAVSEAEAVERIVSFHKEMAGERTVIFTAFNAWFDQRFTSALLARQEVAWRDLFFYHVLDIPSMAWGQGMTGLNATQLSQALGLPDETRVPSEHTGITGAAFNLAVYRALLSRQEAQAQGPTL
jgi:oligoribonuclease (3'-5' exoribonuclease)